MPATYNSSSFNSRTYGKRSSAKMRQSTEKQVPDDDSDGPETSKKRRKVSPTQTRTVTPVKDNATDTEGTSTPPRRPSVRVTYGTPGKSSAPPVSPTVRTPTKLARDLSGIFDSLTPASLQSASPTKLASRMLSRSKTESFIESLPEPPRPRGRASLQHKAPSLPNLPPSSPQKPSNSAEEITPVLPIPVPVQNTATKRTYAGKSRSFLVTVPSSSLSSSALQNLLPEEEEDEYTRESYSSLRTRWGVDNSEDDPYPERSPSGSPARGKGKEKAPPRPPPLPSGMMNPLKSITELRSKGESRRFLDEVGYLFEGMDRSGGIALRRASALELTTKLCDLEFARKAKAADFFGKTWDVFIDAGAGKGEDKILDVLLAFFAALVSRDPASLSDLAQRPPASPPSPPLPSLSSKKQKQQTSAQEHPAASFVDTLFSLLSSSTPLDPLALVAPKSNLSDAELRKVGLGKKDKLTLTGIYNTIASKSFLFTSNTPISTSLLITQALQSLSPSLLPQKHFPALLISLRATLSHTSSSPSSQPPSTSTSSSPSSLASALLLNWRDAPTHVAYDAVYCHLRLLDMYLLGQWAPLSYEGEEEQEQEDVEGGAGAGGGERVKRDNEEVLAKAREGWLVEELVPLGVCAEMSMGKGGDEGDSARKCLEIAMRVLVSLTHADEQWGRKVVGNEYALGWVMRVVTSAGGVAGGADEMGDGNGKGREKKRIKKEEDEEEVGDVSGDEEGDEEDNSEETHALDRLCLALGLLTNLVQVADSAKDAIRETRLDPACTLKKRACVRSCACSRPISALDILVRLYTLQLPKAPPPSGIVKSESGPSSPSVENADIDADASFLRGHLAVLFGLLMAGSQANQATIVAALPAPSSYSQGARNSPGETRAKLSRLVDQARDFVAFYAAISGGSADGEKESRVAREVVKSLERLRDAA